LTSHNSKIKNNLVNFVSPNTSNNLKTCKLIRINFLKRKKNIYVISRLQLATWLVESENGTGVPEKGTDESENGTNVSKNGTQMASVYHFDLLNSNRSL
jgi:hypothetical protein